MEDKDGVLTPNVMLYYDHNKETTVECILSKKDYLTYKESENYAKKGDDDSRLSTTEELK